MNKKIVNLSEWISEVDVLKDEQRFSLAQIEYFKELKEDMENDILKKVLFELLGRDVTIDDIKNCIKAPILPNTEIYFYKKIELGSIIYMNLNLDTPNEYPQKERWVMKFKPSRPQMILENNFDAPNDFDAEEYVHNLATKLNSIR